MHGHARIEERSIRLHAAVAEKLLRDPEILAAARRRVAEWLVSGATARPYAEAWEELLSAAPEDIAERLVDPSERMRALRQCSPFAGALDPRERWAILRSSGDFKA